MSSYQVLVVNDGVPGCLFNADGWDDAIEIVQGYCKQQNIDITNINGEDWQQHKVSKVVPVNDVQ